MFISFVILLLGLDPQCPLEHIDQFRYFNLETLQPYGPQPSYYSLRLTQDVNGINKQINKQTNKPNNSQIQDIVQSVNKAIKLQYLGELSQFLGMNFKINNNKELYINQSKKNNKFGKSIFETL